MTKEKVYDEKIDPLMAQIIAICQEHDISFFADFMLDGDLCCTSCSANVPKHEMLAILNKCAESGHGVNIDLFLFSIKKKFGAGNSVFLHLGDPR